MIETWLIAIRDHPERPPALQRLVLHYLALRMDWGTCRGFASVKQLGDDAGASEPTVRRATQWGRDSGYLLRTRRGHRVSADLVIASEWRLTRPVDNSTQPLTGDGLADPTAQNGRPNRSMAPTQPLTGDAPSIVLNHQELSPSSALIKMIIKEIEKATGRTIGPQWAARTARNLLGGRDPANAGGYVRRAIRDEPDPKTRFLSLYDNADQT